MTLRFPLGSFSKSFIRNLAAEFGLINANKPDSQDICFIPDGNYREFVKKNNPTSKVRGDIVNLNGEVIGHHEGIIDYTIGQRKGIGIGGLKGNEEHTPLYVIEIDKKKNRIVVGPKSKLMKYSIYLKELNLINQVNTL